MPQEKPTLIFLSYRRDDTDAIAENIYHHLKNAFGDVVFKDNMRIGSGDEWDEALRSNLEKAKVVLALIGKKWFVQDEDNCVRLEDDDDWVRKEIEYALENGKVLIPLFIDGAKPPNQRSFRNIPILKEKFPFKQGISISSRQLLKDLHELIHKTLPDEHGILLQEKENGNGEAPEVDVLADYPLTVQPNPDKLPPPYVGMRPFNAGEAFLFFGRDQDILRLIKKLESPDGKKKVLLYHGRSGVGKSSLLTAGLYPRLKLGWETPPPQRRRRERGLAQELNDLLEQHPDDSQQRLFVLDQVEEIFTDPQDDPDAEAAAFQQAMVDFLAKNDNARLVLSFRSDHFTAVRKLLDDQDIAWEELELHPLGRDGVLRAITGVTDRPGLRELFQLRFDPSELPMDIRDDVLKDRNSSHITPLLQYQLRQLFELAAPGWETEKDKAPVAITSAHYSVDFRKDNLEHMVNAEFSALDKAFPEHCESGLVLDVLHHYITEQVTAGSRDDAEIQQQYTGHIADFTALFDFLKHHTSFIIGNRTQKEEAPSSRLAHDSLAPLLLARFRESDAPGQRAWQVLEPKLKDLRRGLAPTSLGAEDLKIVEDGKCGMRQLPELEGLLALSRDKVDRDAAIVLSLTQRNVEFADERAEEAIIKLDYDGALEVAQEAIGLGQKRQRFIRHLQEVAFWKYHGKKEQDAIAALGAIHDHTHAKNKWLADALNQLMAGNGNWENTLERIDPENYSGHILKRYYPDMVFVEGGTFDMGSNENKNEKPIHQVKVDSFHLASTPTTFWQYGLYCAVNGLNFQKHASGWGVNGDNPVINVEWYDAIEFANWLSGRFPGLENEKVFSGNLRSEKVIADWSKTGYRLPTEAEWEYAAKGGNHHSPFNYAGSDNPDEVAWYSANAQSRTQPVGLLKANALGLHDMSGNVYELCWDWYDEKYYKQFVNRLADNPLGPRQGSSRVRRGGSWYDGPAYLRCASRYSWSPDSRYDDLGFRLARAHVTL